MGLKWEPVKVVSHTNDRVVIDIPTGLMGVLVTGLMRVMLDELGFECTCGRPNCVIATTQDTIIDLSMNAQLLKLTDQYFDSIGYPSTRRVDDGTLALLRMLLKSPPPSSKA